jgi:hypothetical protein
VTVPAAGGQARIARVLERCPACRAGLAGSPTCRRCGADLRAVLELVLDARRLCHEAKAALERGDAARAYALAHASVLRHATPEGQRLMVLSRWLLLTPERGAAHEGRKPPSGSIERDQPVAKEAADEPSPTRAVAPEPDNGSQGAGSSAQQPAPPWWRRVLRLLAGKREPPRGETRRRRTTRR